MKLPEPSTFLIWVAQLCARRHRQGLTCVRSNICVWGVSAGLVLLTWSFPGLVFAVETGAVGKTMAKEPDGEIRSGLVEPIITEETLPNEPGELSLRLSTEYRKKGSEVTAAAPRVQVFYGLIERLGVEVDVPFIYRKGESKAYGTGDVSESLKWLAVREGAMVPAVVLGLENAFPTGDADKGTGEGAYEMTPFIALAKDFGALSIQGNVGWSKQVDGGEQAESCVYNWALAVPVFDKRLYLLAEVNGDCGGSNSPDRAAFAPGIKFNWNHEKAFVALAVPVGLNKNTDDWGLVMQFQFKF